MQAAIALVVWDLRCLVYKHMPTTETILTPLEVGLLKESRQKRCRSCHAQGFSGEAISGDFSRASATGQAEAPKKDDKAVMTKGRPIGNHPGHASRHRASPRGSPDLDGTNCAKISEIPSDSRKEVHRKTPKTSKKLEKTKNVLRKKGGFVKGRFFGECALILMFGIQEYQNHGYLLPE